MRTVLIVDDHCASRDVLTQLVEKDGRAVVTAGDGLEALNRVRSVPPPSLILLDLSMPRMNGWEFLRYKTADPTIARIPTIVLSGSATDDLPAGAMDLLAKPVDVERLLALIDQYC
jgi:CheY-like chemotaxis protein